MTAMPEPREENRSERRQALIEAAFALIAKRGFEGLRLRDVAEAAGIDHSTLHHYFSTKQDLIDGVVGYAVGLFRLGREHQAEPESLHLHLAGQAQLMDERPDLFVVMRELDLRAMRDAAVRRIIERPEEGWRSALATRLESGGFTAGGNPDDAVELIIAAIKGISLHPRSAADVFSMLEQLLRLEAVSR
jgi:AcrR family transcriptional regulator